jgi:hypothetical protein
MHPGGCLYVESAQRPHPCPACGYAHAD